MDRTVLAIVLMLGATATAGCSLAACSAFGADDPATPPVAPTVTPSADAAPIPTQSDGGEASDAGGSQDASDGAPPCVATNESATIEADTFLPTGNCDGSNSFGATTNLNVSSGALAMVRFTWSPAAEAAAVAGRLTSLTLTIDQNPTCDNTCGTNAHVPGTFSVRPARTDWDEGNGMPYNGADQCRRTIGTAGGTGFGWGITQVTASGATLISKADVGETSIANFNLAPGGTKLAFDIPGAGALFGTRDAGKVAFLLVGGASAVFFGAARESAMHPEPALLVRYCK